MMKLQATYENGVFVPVEPPLLAENERVQLTVEPLDADAAFAALASVEKIQLRRQRRIVLDPDLAQQIASSPEFLPDES